ncbi:bacteriorhodopsin [Halomarina ordinaria]|uniref:Bacteriorhodopsin n=1 Tax=Halomarina ordinaria TaxID=3033939 RepID=A0ABD5U7S9_9EURY|nr:bacteriorhodopsin [Halomarina sp. PSRA2]
MVVPTPPFTVVGPLQADDLVAEALSNALLASSLWLNVALMGVALLLFTYLGRGVTDEYARLILVATIGIPAVSIASYLGLISGLTVGVVDIPGRGESVTLWGRYLTWTFSTPLILVALGLLAGTNVTKLFTAVVFDVAMCVTGLAAAMTSRALWLRWAWFALSTAFFLVVLYVLLVEWPRDVADQDPSVQRLFGRLKYLTTVLWVGYPVVWALGTEGLALFGTGATGLAATSWLYTLLDVGAKFVFALLLVRFLATERPVVTRHGLDRERAEPADD